MKSLVKTYTKKQIKSLVNLGLAVDLTQYRLKARDKVINDEKYLELIGIAKGIYGINAKLLRGATSGNLYAITDRTSALYIF